MKRVRAASKAGLSTAARKRRILGIGAYAAAFWLAGAREPSPALADSRSAVVLPQLDRTAQSQALGNDAASLTGLNALGINPAGLNTPRAEVLTQYQQLPLQTSLTLLGASYPLRPFGASLGVSYLDLRSANFDGRDDSGAQTGRFSTDDRMIGLHIGGPLGEDSLLTLGASVKFMQMGIASQSAGATALDIGGRYKLAALPLIVGLSALNVGRGPRFGDQRSSLPTTYVIAAAYKLLPELELLGNYADDTGDGRKEVSFGLQYWAAGVMALRARMVNSAASQGTGVQNLAAGIGFKVMGQHTIDYAFRPYDSALRQAGSAGTHLITLTLRFGQSAAPARERSLGLMTNARSRNTERPAPAARALPFLAFEAARAGRFAEAETRLRQAVDAAPGKRELQGMLSRLALVAEAVPEAVEGDGAAPLLRQGALLYVETGAPERAVTTLRQAVDADVADRRALKLLNKLEEKAGLELTRLSGAEPGLNLAQQKIQAARRAAYDGNAALAVKYAAEALSIEPGNLMALQVLGSAYYLAGDYAHARESWNRVLETDPGNERVASFLKRFGQ